MPRASTLENTALALYTNVMSSTRAEVQPGQPVPLLTDGGGGRLAERQPPPRSLPASIIPSAVRELFDPMPDFLATWGELFVLDKIVPQLSCGEAESLADVFANAEAHHEADAVRAIHLKLSESPCMVDHNTGMLIE